MVTVRLDFDFEVHHVLWSLGDFGGPLEHVVMTGAPAKLPEHAFVGPAPEKTVVTVSPAPYTVIGLLQSYSGLGGQVWLLAAGLSHRSASRTRAARAFAGVRGVGGEGAPRVCRRVGASAPARAAPFRSTQCQSIAVAEQALSCLRAGRPWRSWGSGLRAMAWVAARRADPVDPFPVKAARLEALAPIEPSIISLCRVVDAAPWSRPDCS